MEALEQWDAAVPGLLLVGFIKRHHPFDPPQSWALQYAPQEMALLPGWTPQLFPHDLARGKGYFDCRELTEEALRRCTAFYYATISQLDFQVGRMISVLKKKGLYDSTLIGFTADHGEYLGFHHLLLKGNHMYDPATALTCCLPAGQVALMAFKPATEDTNAWASSAARGAVGTLVLLLPSRAKRPES